MGREAAECPSLEAGGEGTFGRCQCKEDTTTLRPKELAKDSCVDRKEKTIKNQGLKATVVTL